MAAGRSATSLKKAYLKRYGIPARMLNGVGVSLEGKIASVPEARKLRQDSLGRRIARAEREIARAEERAQWQQKRRRSAYDRLLPVAAAPDAGRARPDQPQL